MDMRSHFQRPFCHWVVQCHDPQGVRYPLDRDNWCIADHPLLFRTHPLFRFGALAGRIGGGVRMLLMWVWRSISNYQPLLFVPAMVPFAANSLVSLRRCWCGVNVGSWQCWGKSSVELETGYACVLGMCRMPTGPTYVVGPWTHKYRKKKWRRFLITEKLWDLVV